MATPTYDPIASVNSSGSNVSFTNIDQSYRDLVIVIDGAGTGGLGAGDLTFNSDNSYSYYHVMMGGTGSSAVSSTSTYDRVNPVVYGSYFMDGVAQIVWQIFDYSATDKHKSVLTRTNYPDGAYPIVAALATRWANTSAITQIDVRIHPSETATVSLYGIAA